MFLKLINFLHTLFNEIAGFFQRMYGNMTVFQRNNQTEQPLAKSPARLSHFNRLKVIGDGHFGMVYQVQHKVSSQIFAMKVISHPTTGLGLNHLEDEKRVLRNLKSPFICEMLHYFKTDAKHYFVFEFFAGGDLFHLVQQKTKLPETTGRFYLAEFALGLEFLHSHNVVHRDLKTENLMLDIRGHVKIIDFGFCKVLRRGDKTDTFCGTNRFIAPEILRNEDYDHSVDLWSYGAVMFKMLAGRELIQGVIEEEIFEKTLAGNFEFPRSMSTHATSLLSNLLTCDPLQRMTIPQLKQSEFFRKMDWEKMESGQCEPPIKPKINNNRDVSQFDDELVQRQILQSPQKQDVLEEKENNLFVDFDFNERPRRQTARPLMGYSAKSAAKRSLVVRNS